MDELYAISSSIRTTGLTEAQAGLAAVVQGAEAATDALTGTERAADASSQAAAQLAEGMAAAVTQTQQAGRAVVDTLGAYAELSGRLSETTRGFQQGKLSQAEYRAALKQITADVTDYTASVALTSSELSGFEDLLAQANAALQGSGASVSAATQAMREIQTQLTAVKAEFKAGTLTESQYEARLVGLNATLKEVAQTESLTAQEQRTYNALLLATTAAVRPASDALQVIRTALAELNRGFKEGRLSQAQYDEGLRTLNADLRQLEATMELSSAEQRQFTTLLGQTTPRAAQMSTQGLGTVRSAIASLATQALGAAGPVGSLVSGVSQFAVGSTLAVGVVAGLAAVALGYQVLTADSRRLHEQNQQLADSFYHEADGADKLARSIKGLDAALTEAERHEANAAFWEALGNILHNPLGGFGGGVDFGFGLPGRQAKGQREEAAKDQQAAAEAAKGYVQQTMAAYAEAVRLGTASKTQTESVLAYIRQLHAAAADTTKTLVERNTAEREAAELTAAMEKGAKKAVQAQREWVTSLADQVGLYKQLAAVEGMQPANQVALFQALQQVNRALENQNLTLRERITLMKASGEASAMLFAPSGIVENMNGQLPLKEKELQRLMDEPLKLVNAKAPKPSDFEQLEQGFAKAIATSVGDGIAAGFDAVFSSGHIDEGFGALLGTLLSGLGSAAEQFGAASLVISQTMQAIFDSLASFLPGGAVGASIAMIAIGAALKAGGKAAASAFSAGSSAYRGGSGFGSGPGDVTRIILQPTGVQQASQLRPLAPIGPNYFFGPDDPTVQRQFMETYRNALVRNL